MKKILLLSLLIYCIGCNLNQLNENSVFLKSVPIDEFKQFISYFPQDTLPQKFYAKNLGSFYFRNRNGTAIDNKYRQFTDNYVNFNTDYDGLSEHAGMYYKRLDRQQDSFYILCYNTYNDRWHSYKIILATYSKQTNHRLSTMIVYSMVDLINLIQSEIKNNLEIDVKEIHDYRTIVLDNKSDLKSFYIREVISKYKINKYGVIELISTKMRDMVEAIDDVENVYKY